MNSDSDLIMIEKTNITSEQSLIKIGGMQCSFCVESIRKAYVRMDGIVDISINLSHEEAMITYEPNIINKSQLDDTMRNLGYSVRDPKKIRSVEEEQEELKYHRNQLLLASGLTSIALGFMIAAWSGYGQSWFRWIMLPLTLIMIFGVGGSILKMAFASIRRGIFNQHVLMEFGAFGGFIGGLIGFYKPIDASWPMADFMGAAIFITTYHILSGYVSLVVRTKSSRSIMKLMDLQPSTARLIVDGVEKEVLIEEIKKTDNVIVKPGESIPVDGIIIEGESSVDQSLVTGEPIPVNKGVNDEVIGGSLNQFGSLIIEVTKVGEESFLQQVAKSIQEARALKPGILQAVEKVLKYFVPGVLIAASFSFIIWTLGAWIFVGEPNFQRAIFSTLAVLVMGYPCALGMATPLAMIRGSGLAAEKGILMRSGEAFQVFKDVKIIAMDKTGTITEGKPKVVDVIPLNGYNTIDLISLAYKIESTSEHPLAHAIVTYARENNFINKNLAIENFKAISGLGIRAMINNKQVLVGSPRFLKEEGIKLDIAENNLLKMENQGWTAIGVANDSILVGILAIADTLKQDTVMAIKLMKSNGLEPILITGDNKGATNFIANQVGISKVFSEVLPQEKSKIIRSLQENGSRVTMVGDGINDAPALMQADVGIAFSSGTDIAIEAADIILVSNQLEGVINAYHIGKKSYKKTKQNVSLAFAFNGIGVPLAITGLVHPVFAMIAMAASVTTVLLNSYGGKLIPKKLEKEVETDKNHQIIYTIPTMHCGGCIEGLKDSLEGNNGVVLVGGDAELKSLVIDFNNEVNFKRIKKIISKEGHKISEEVLI